MDWNRVTYPQSPILCGPAVVSLVSEDGGGGWGWEGGGPTGVICCQAAGTRSCCPRLDQACYEENTGKSLLCNNLLYNHLFMTCISWAKQHFGCYWAKIHNNISAYCDLSSLRKLDFCSSTGLQFQALKNLAPDSRPLQITALFKRLTRECIFLLATPAVCWFGLYDLKGRIGQWPFGLRLYYVFCFWTQYSANKC